MKIVLDRETINNISLSDFVERFPHGSRYHLLSPPGEEPYKLYAHLSMYFDNSLFADLGTRGGNSALALSYNQSNLVHSYDIDESSYNAAKNRIQFHNVEFFKEDILTNEKLLNYSLIHIDVDPHDSTQERKCFEFLLKNDWKGLVLLDDIGGGWPAMNSWWNSLEMRKFDLTKFGHASGTGLVDFCGELEIEIR